MSDHDDDREQRVAAYGLLIDGDRALVASTGLLPGGPVGDDEDPVDVVRRAFLDRTSLVVHVGDVLSMWSEMDEDGTHSVLLVFEIDSWTGDVDATTNPSTWEPIGTDDDARLAFARSSVPLDHDR
jgi:ADP-ribose pyrophosphatase YjhB (NUDIX family)